MTGLTGNTQYYVQVSAFNGSGESIKSGTVPVLTLIGTPVMNASTSVTGSSFTASWTTGSGAATYQFEVSTSNTFSPLFASYTGLTGTSQAVSGLAAGTTYYLRARGVSSSGTVFSPYSTTLSTTTLLVVPNATAPSAVAEQSFTANWLVSQV